MLIIEKKIHVPGEHDMFHVYVSIEMIKKKFKLTIVFKVIMQKNESIPHGVFDRCFGIMNIYSFSG